MDNNAHVLAAHLACGMLPLAHIEHELECLKPGYLPLLWHQEMDPLRDYLLVADDSPEIPLHTEYPNREAERNYQALVATRCTPVVMFKAPGYEISADHIRSPEKRLYTLASGFVFGSEIFAFGSPPYNLLRSRVLLCLRHIMLTAAVKYRKARPKYVNREDCFLYMLNAANKACRKVAHNMGGNVDGISRLFVFVGLEDWAQRVLQTCRTKGHYYSREGVL